jgi:hypothetical protein
MNGEANSPKNGSSSQRVEQRATARKNRQDAHQPHQQAVLQTLRRQSVRTQERNAVVIATIKQCSYSPVLPRVGRCVRREGQARARAPPRPIQDSFGQISRIFQRAKNQQEKALTLFCARAGTSARGADSFGRFSVTLFRRPKTSVDAFIQDNSQKVSIFNGFR